MNALVILCRVLVGALFIISGLIKANDPLGFSYKLEEYFAESALNLPFLAPLSLALGVLACVGEIVLGFALVVGGRMKITYWLLMALVVFFGWLTLYTATCDPNATYMAMENGKEVKKTVTCVTDCGCFGDAMKGSIGRSLTPWESFYKDLIIFVLLIPVFFRYRSLSFNTTKDDKILLPATALVLGLLCWVFSWYFPLIFFVILCADYLMIKKGVQGVASEWVTAVSTFVLSCIFAWFCYHHLPIRDYRPFAIGKSIIEGKKIPEGAPADEFKTTLVYEKNGVQKEFTMDNYPWQDSTWVWKETRNVLVKKGYEPPIKDFVLTSPDGRDLTDSILQLNNYTFLLVAYNLEHAEVSNMSQIATFADKVHQNKMLFIGLTSSPSQQIETFRHEHQAAFDFYSGDEKVLKTMIRSNPGLILLKKGVVVDMWHVSDFPTFEEFAGKYPDFK